MNDGRFGPVSGLLGKTMKGKTANSCGHQPSRPGQVEQLLTITEVAEWLGVSTSTLYHHDPSEGPNRIKFGNLIRYRRCCVTAWLDEHLVMGSEAPND